MLKPNKEQFPSDWKHDFPADVCKYANCIKFWTKAHPFSWDYFFVAFGKGYETVWYLSHVMTT